MTGRRPVKRRRVLLGAAIAAMLLAGIILLAESLRHPAPSGGPVTIEVEDDPEADPRTEVVCPEPESEGDPTEDEVTIDPEAEPVSVTSNELYDCPQWWDGRRVRYEGEAVAGVLAREGGAWVQVNDDIYAGTQGPLPAHRDYRGGNAGIGVFVDEVLAASIEQVGGPQQRGDLVEVTGTFHRVDPDSAEVAVIRADAGEVLRRGEPFTDVRLRDREIAAAVLALVTLSLVILERWRSWTRRRSR